MSGVLAPLGALFRHTRSSAPEADEILLLSFNHDLAFFEKAALAVVQLTGARITVVADAAMAHHDVYAVRRAGTAYLPGLAHCSGSFHPKLVVVASADRATVGVGSGNLSMAGWQGNDELWSWHHATAEVGSTVIPAVGNWLSALAGPVSVSTPVAEALRRIGALLAGFLTNDDASRLVDTLSGPIIDQLPAGPVDELNVYAPFFDPNAAALSALIERLEPVVLRVGYQPTMTKINGAAVAELIGAKGEIRALPEERYRHGKVIEWVASGQRWALTGSANISAAALLSTVSSGGNVELGVIAPTDDTLMPAGAVTAAAHLASVEYKATTPSAGPVTVVLAATRSPNGVDLEFVRPLRSAGRIEVSEVNWPPDYWEPIASVITGQPGTVVRDAPGGSRIRVRFDDGSLSAVAWVTDLARVQRTRAAVRSGPRPPELGEVFSDVAAAEKFFQLNLDRQKSIPAPQLYAEGTRTGGRALPTVESWEEYLDRCAGRVGAYTFAFSFGLPLPTQQADHSVQVRVSDWDDDTLDDDAEALEGDTTEDADIDEQRRLVSPQLSQAQERVRSRYRSFARRMIHDWVAPDPQERLLALRSALLLVAGGAWDYTEEDWRPLVLDGIEQLLIEDAGPKYAEAAASLGLLALSIVKNTLSSWGRGLVEGRYARTLDRVADVLIEANPERVAEYADGLTRRFPASARPEIAMAIAERLTADELDNALDDLADQGVAVERAGRIVDLTKPVPDPLLGALWALAAIEEAAPLAVRCASTDGRFVNVLWRPPDLVVIESTKPGARWTRHYRYKAGRRPGADIRLNSRLDGDWCVATTSVREPLPAIATELLDELGVAQVSAPS